ncbi:CocE/NonD family hydrolase [Halorubrum sp. JWXQ-INN 858]|uniref:CocE/NonD family hydrolase n=1 Tax=Halorubrum sp. JWXQ-INN 858 TaxID=2690782 RepID=UPI00135CD70C|nr:CocE/NonD family hydrolase [Halorubrum sp. JWXQ-INN 858]MWV65064.1 CocE/NonD family hydrolase [Halorubrum sp. JWXQ-INN 858]
MNPETAIRLHHDVRIPVGDGTVAATRYEPTDRDGAPFPAVLMAIPYRKDDYITFGAYDPLLRYIARAGYEVIVADLPGTGGSSGVKPQPLDDREGDAVAAVIEWLGEREWTDGTVGTVGKSYGGWTQYLAASRRPDALKAIVPIMAPFSGYDDSRYPTGAMSFKHTGGWLPRMHTFEALPPSYRDDEGRWAEVWRERLDGMADRGPWLFDQQRNPTKNAYWADNDADVERVDVPVFAICGWRDYFSATTMTHLDRIDAPTRLLMGPWRHTLPYQGREVAVECRDRIVEWFDRFLKGAENGALDRPRVTYWTERDGGGVVDGGVWRTREEWPTADGDGGALTRPAADVLSFALTPDGLSRAADSDDPAAAVDGSLEATYDGDATVGVESIHYLSPPLDTNGDDARSLTFETEPAADPVELTGTGTARLRVQSTEPDVLLSVRLVDVSPDGSASLLTYGTVRTGDGEAADDEGGDGGTGDGDGPGPLTPGAEHTVEVPLRPLSHVLEPGHRLRVAVGTSFFPRLLAPRAGATITVRSDATAPSVVTLPGAVHADGFDPETVTLPEPDTTGGPLSSPFVTRSEGEWETTREHRSDTVTVHTTDEKTIELPHGPTMRWRETVRWSVTADDPATARTWTDIEAELDYGSDVVRAETTARTTHDGSNLAVHLTHDGQTVLDRTWRL